MSEVNYYNKTKKFYEKRIKELANSKNPNMRLITRYRTQLKQLNSVFNSGKKQAYKEIEFMIKKLEIKAEESDVLLVDEVSDYVLGKLKQNLKETSKKDE